MTWCDPAGIASLPEKPRLLPQSCVTSGSQLYKNGRWVDDCPNLSVSSGDDVSIERTNTQIHFYKNKQLHYTWSIETPAPVWAVVGVYGADKMSIKGELSTVLQALAGIPSPIFVLTRQP